MSDPYIHVVNILLSPRPGEYCFLLRTNTEAYRGSYSFPGGRLELGEDIHSAAIREAKEEVGATIAPADLKLVHTLQERREDGQIIFAFFFLATTWQGELTNNEPQLHGDMKVCAPSNLPSPLMERHQVVIDAIAHDIPFTSRM